ncbi:hypothetical protein MHYP_G00310470 [Metynnis hypsauchen]
MQFKDNPVDRNRLDIVLRGRWEETLTSGRYQCCIEKSVHAQHATSGEGPCLVCQHTSVPWSNVPLTVADLQHVNVTGGMGQVITQSASFYSPLDKEPPRMMLQVPAKRGTVCACSLTPGGLELGWSRCYSYIVVIANGTKCVANLTVFDCSMTSPRGLRNAMWICGFKAFGALPKDGRWRGCCYPGLIVAKTQIFTPARTTPQEHVNYRTRRSVEWYRGYKLMDPWTTPAASIGWSLFLGGGTAATLLKINGLAYQLMVVLNDSSSAINAVRLEQQAIRAAVLEHRQALVLAVNEEARPATDSSSLVEPVIPVWISKGEY